MEQPAVLVLSSTNETFTRKEILVPCHPDRIVLGRQFDDTTTATPTNVFFDSKVLSKQHAEVWADRDSKIWVRDLKSSNGTYVNGQRLSPENRMSEPHELLQYDTLELGVDITSDTRQYHRISARVEFAGSLENKTRVLDS